eukprot:TRINITY_DN51139_c0_g1_i1.p1 TRINITY_DN51139_c0_g1~~TRINITY_DN51139_c0_g1_i1.p1  ORF type:complete len:137 (-),score=20.45 TRINITY_DN51139_c0_g1_i1:152-562(-)
MKAVQRCPYEVLGVSRTASLEEIERAWRRNALVMHPDKAPEGERDHAEIRFKELSAAHDVLTDSIRRRLYDRHGFDIVDDKTLPEEDAEYRPLVLFTQSFLHALLTFSAALFVRWTLRHVGCLFYTKLLFRRRTGE